MPFQKVQSEKLSIAVVRQIELLILRGILRPGERLTLRRMEQRIRRQQQATQKERRRHSEQLTEKRQACEARRHRMRNTRDRATIKELSRQLRRHCW